MTDTLAIDTAQIAQWQAQQDLDYNKELVGGGTTFTEWLLMQVNDLLNDLFGIVWKTEYTGRLLAFLGAVTLVIVVWYLWRHHPWLFMRQNKLTPDHDAEEDTIYGIDFDAAIVKALAHEDYREAIRMLYLQTLKALSDHHIIDWQLYKTPMQYVAEATSPHSPLCSGAAAATAAAAAFPPLTRHFLRVRYGNFPADRPLYDEVKELQRQVLAGIRKEAEP